MITREINRVFPEGYWPKGMDNSAQARSIDEFSRAIYPAWKGTEAFDSEAEGKLTMEEIRAPGQVLFEAKTIHKQDLAIRRSGNKPAREFMQTADLRKKAVAGEKYAGWSR